MKIIYEKQNRGRYISGLQKLSLLLVMMLFGLTTAFAQNLSTNSPVSYSGTLTLTLNPAACSGITSVTFAGPGGFSQVDATAPYSVTRSGMLPNGTFVGGYTATINGGSCTGNIYSANVCVLPAKPVITGANRACVDEVTTYTTPLIGTDVYTWSVSNPAHALVVGGGQNAGVDFVSVQWLAGAVGQTSWVRVTAANTCGGTQSDIFFVNVYNNPIPPTLTPATSFYCHGENGVSLTVGNVQANNDYYLYTFPGDVLVDFELGVLSAADFTFDNVKVDDDALTPQASTDFRVVAVNPNVCFNQSTIVTVTKYAHPEAAIEVNGNPVGFNYSESLCYTETVGISLVSMVTGKTPLQSVTWAATYDDGTGPVAAAGLSGTQANPVLPFNFNFTPATLPAGVYVFSITELIDGNGCQPNDYTPYKATITIWEEPTVTIDVVTPTLDVIAPNATSPEYTFCYNYGEFGIRIVGADGTGDWTLDYEISGPGGFSDIGQLIGTAGVVAVDLDGSYAPGIYTFEVTGLSDIHCTAGDVTGYSFQIEVYEEPMISFGFNGVEAGHNASFTYCYDEQITVDLHAIYGGTAPFSVTYTLDAGTPVTVTGLDVNGVIAGPQTLAAGVHNIVVTEIKDFNGCVASPAFLAFCTATITINPEPTLAITIDGNSIFGEDLEYCYDADILFDIAGGDGIPTWTFNWQVENASNIIIMQHTGDWVGATPESLSFPADALIPGDYVVKITSLVDGNGCFASAATLATYFVNLKINPEPTAEIKVDGVVAHGASLERCWNDQIVITVDGVIGTADWTMDWAISGPASFSDVMTGASGSWNYDLSLFPTGTYTFTVNSLVDENGCAASATTLAAYGFTIQVNPKPNPFFTIDGNVLTPNAIVEYCETSLTEINIAITATEGVNTDPGTAPYDIVFDIRENNGAGTILGTYTLPDVAYDAEVDLFALSPAWYTVPGTYYLDITSLFDDNGCEISAGDYPYYEFTLVIYEQPVADAGADWTVCDYSVDYALAATASVGTGLWTKATGPGAATFDDNASPTTTVTVDVAGTYTFTWTETNGICTDADDVIITFLTGSQANAATLSDVQDIYTIPETPFLVELQAIFPDLTGTDPLILSDALIEYNGVGIFPAGAKIIKILYSENASPWFNIPVVAGNIGGLSEVYLSEVVNNANTLVYHSGKTIDWKIYIEGVNTIPATIPVKISIVSYLAANTACYGVQAFDEFDIYTGDVIMSDIADVVACYPDPIQYSYTETYPLIQNIGGNEVLNDGKFTFWADAVFTIPVSLPIGTKITATTPVGNTKISTLTVAANTVYGSAVVAQQSDPTTNQFGYLLSLERPATVTPNSWTVKIENSDPGTVFVKYENVALLNVNTAGYPYTEYVYNTQDFKVNYVGSNGVSFDPIANVATVTGAPVIVPFTVNYALETNIDDSVLEDALFEVNADVTILDLTYAGVSQLVAPVAVAANTPTLLSTIMGSSPYPLNYQPGSTAEWTVTVVADAAIAQTVNATIEAIAYVTAPPTGCYSVMDTETASVTWADMTVTTSNAAIVCEGTDSELHFDIQYPAIVANPNSILVDVVITCDIDIPANTEVTWTYNSGPTGTYTFNSVFTAGTEIKFSDIIGAAPNPLQGHGGLDIDIDLVFANLEVGVYTLDLVTVATLEGTDYDLYDSNETPVIEVYEVPDATISQVPTAVVYSGSTHTYSVAVPANGVPTYSWSSDQSSSVVVITNTTDRQPSIEFVWPFTGTVELTVTVSNGICEDEKTFEVEVLPNILAGQLKYYNSQESPMPSPFMVDFLGLEMPAYFYVGLVESSSVPQPGGGYTFIGDPVAVQEIYGEENDLLGDPVYEAAFMFEYNLNPDENYAVVVWDDPVSFIDGSDNYGYWTMNNWGGVTAVDALLVQHMAAGSQINTFPNMQHVGANSATPAYGYFAHSVGDVSMHNNITGLDALLTARRAAGLIPFFINNSPNFQVAGKFVDEADFNEPNVFGVELPDIEFERPTPVTAPYESLYEGELSGDPLGLGNHFLNIYYNATGDVNSNYVPAYGGFKAAPVMELTFEGEMAASVGQEISLPITLDSYTTLGAMGLGLNYRNDLIQVVATNYGEDFALIDHENGTVTIAWANMDGTSFDVDDVIAELTVRILQPVAPGTRLFELNGFTELAETDATIIENVNFKSIGVNTSGVNGDFTTNVYPNPFNNQSVISYSMPEAGKVTVTIYNKMGQVVKTMVSEYQDAGQHQLNVNSTDLSGAGMYYYKVEVDGETQHLSSTNSMILIR